MSIFLNCYSNYKIYFHCYIKKNKFCDIFFIYKIKFCLFLKYKRFSFITLDISFFNHLIDFNYYIYKRSY